MKKIKAAVIGTGGISEVHISGYLAMPERVELYALCDIDEEKALKKAEKYNVPKERVYTDYNEMLKDPEIDVVSVCTWNAAHAPATIAALNAGKNVICEKPMAMNAEEAKAMQEAAERNGKLLMIGFVRRYGNDCRVARDFIEGGNVGDIYYAKATYLRRHGFPGGWFGDKNYSGGGPLIDLGVHVIDLARYLMGNHLPVSVYGVTSNKLGCRPDLKSTKSEYVSTSRGGNYDFNVEDFAAAMVRFDNGAVLSVEASFDLNIKEGVGNLELFGTKGGLKLSPELELFTNLNGYMVNVSSYTSTALSFEGLFENEIAHFIDCVNGEKQCISPAEDGVVLMKILDAIYESARTGHEVIIK